MTAKGDWAIVVGIEDYPGLESNELEGVINDADAFRRWLIHDAGLPERQVLFEVSPKARAKTKKGAKPPYAAVSVMFTTIVDRVLAKLKKGNPQLGRRLYIYLGGHGFEPDGSEPALLTADASEAAMSHIAGRLYAEYFRKAACFSEVVLIMDCCRTATSSVPLTGVPLTKLINPGAGARWFYAYATLSTGVAREAGNGKTARGLFTTTILEGLQGAAAINGKVTDRSLKDFVERRMRSKVDPDNEQVPELKVDDQATSLVLHELAVQTHQVTLTFPAKSVGKPYQIFGKGNQLVSGEPAAKKTVVLDLENGTYAVFLDGNFIDGFRVEGKDLARKVRVV